MAKLACQLYFAEYCFDDTVLPDYRASYSLSIIECLSPYETDDHILSASDVGPPAVTY